MSIYNSTKTNYNLIIIDDCSSDQRVGQFLDNLHKYRNDYCKELIIRKNPTNMGLVRTINQAYTQVKNNFVILSPNVEVPDGWLERLIFPIETRDNIASTTPFTNVGTICSFPVWLEDNQLPFAMDVDQVDTVFKLVNTDTTLQIIPSGVGCCMGINKHVVDTIGWFDTTAAGEENDWCQRAIKVGYLNLHITNLFVYNKLEEDYSGEQKNSFIAKNYKKLLTKYPDYEKQVITYIKDDPLKDLRLTLLIKLAVSHKNTVLVIDHGIGGGTGKFLSENIYNKHELVICIHGIYSLTEVILSIMYFNKEYLKITLPSLPFFIVNFLKGVKFKHFYINHLLTIQDTDLCRQIIQNHSLESSFYIHDFLALCPSYNLINNKGRFCGAETDLGICNRCIANNKYYDDTHIKYSNMENWRAAYSNLLNSCDKIYCASEDSKRHVIRVYPFLLNKTVVVAPHTLHHKLSKQVTNISYHHQSQIIIGVLGTINYPKGRKILEELVKYPLFKTHKFKLIIIGATDIKIPKVMITGPYRHMELPNLVKKYKIDLCLIPSICPETFCYTAEEIMQMGFPLICFDIGAHAQRVKQYDKGKIVYSLTASAMYDKIIEVVDLYS